MVSRVVNPVKRTIAANGYALGTFVYSSDPGIAEAAALAGFDFVVIDTEHTALTEREVQDAITSAHAGGASAFVRVRGADPATVGNVLDLGASGVVIPHLGATTHGASLADAARFAPRGFRGGCSTTRATAYGQRPLAQYVAEANDDIWVIALVEEVDAIDRLPELLAAGEIDVVIPGRGDLAVGLGVPGEMSHPRVLEVVDQIFEIVAAANTAIPGMYVSSAEDIGVWVERGARFLVCGIDYQLMSKTYMAIRRDFDKATHGVDLVDVPAAVTGGAQ